MRSNPHIGSSHCCLPTSKRCLCWNHINTMKNTYQCHSIHHQCIPIHHSIWSFMQYLIQNTISTAIYDEITSQSKLNLFISKYRLYQYMILRINVKSIQTPTNCTDAPEHLETCDQRWPPASAAGPRRNRRPRRPGRSRRSLKKGMSRCAGGVLFPMLTKKMDEKRWKKNIYIYIYDYICHWYVNACKW